MNFKFGYFFRFWESKYAAKMVSLFQHSTNCLTTSVMLYLVQRCIILTFQSIQGPKSFTRSCRGRLIFHTADTTQQTSIPILSQMIKYALFFTSICSDLYSQNTLCHIHLVETTSFPLCFKCKKNVSLSFFTRTAILQNRFLRG